MRRTTRTAVGLTTAVVMAVTTAGTAQATDTSAREARQAADATTGLLTEITRTESLLGEAGLSLLDFAGVEEKSPEFLAELERLLDDWEPEPAPEPEPEPDEALRFDALPLCYRWYRDGRLEQVPCPITTPSEQAPPPAEPDRTCDFYTVDGEWIPMPCLSALAAEPATTASGSDAARAEMIAQWLAHAYTMAEVNSARDRDARDIGTETVYMYLSHYVDLPQDPTQYPVDHNSNANRYAAWITPDDRRVFDQYLRYDRHVEMAYQVTQLGEALRGLTGVQGAARHAWQNAHRWGAKILGLTSVGWNAGIDGVSGQEVKAVLTDAWNATDDPEAAIRMVEEGLKSQYGTAIGTKEMTGLMLAAAATVAGAPVGLVAALVTTSLTVSLARMKDVVDQAMLAGLLATASSRVTLRYFRSIGMD
ncbi:hypothetical protein [Cellulosimicrobium cellulans]|uniref:hypothetical protein n=1 Tax=Cellulosimicrobium cellulans TaxID=1710 RepID=UPI00130E794B|nr:hypothetical protein [Cellulosimicrobium cellulans]